MLTKNFNICLTNLINGVSGILNPVVLLPISTTGSRVVFNGNPVHPGINTFKTFINLSDDGSTNHKNLAIGVSILVGSGMTDPTENDYTLENVISLTHISGSASTSANSFLTVSRTLKNDSTETVTINEVGLFYNFLEDSNDTARTVTLFAREVLTSPITMKPGESYTFTFML